MQFWLNELPVAAVLISVYIHEWRHRLIYVLTECVIDVFLIQRKLSHQKTLTLVDVFIDRMARKTCVNIFFVLYFFILQFIQPRLN